jgi:hypothetical protein
MGFDRSKLVSRFESFAAEARGLMSPKAAAPVPREVRRRFERFASLASDLLLGRTNQYVPWLSEALKPLERSLEAEDVLRIAGITHDEDRYTELLSWLLRPAAHHRLGEACQRAWVRHATGREPLIAVAPRTQVWTDDGIPDLVLPYPERPLIVEAKTRTAEHATPRTRQMQTVSYPAAVNSALGLPPDGPTDVVFLTLDRAAPANATARAMSYLESAQVLAAVVETQPAPDDVRAAYRIVLGHLARAAVPTDFDLGSTLQAVRAWREDPQVRLMPFLAALTRCEDLLPRSERL